MELVKPWRDEEGYLKARLAEALYEAELARRFLEEGLCRNAAGKAYRAWKALLAALALKERDILKEAFRGAKKLRNGKRLSEIDWIIAFMPSTRVRAVAQILARKYGDELLMYTDIALNLHEYQYNGPDKEGVFSRYRDDEAAREDVARLIRGIEKLREPLAREAGSSEEKPGRI
ncbi:PaREP1 domain containing protein [Thermoproteus uzoniensis 768-20]|uniref:PaREP1 domain containing protein n=1 Tax=Thermoproteus uzoniensis (strain 768-20) TaxID=999630 RepID=F2L642_THEU7|nr:PaREP1 family protein [Thermoproteus uzoniensis]AEA13658.1 PaREP1 domain containing protein [Thermoproteus uzoniensis 768-20]